MGSGRSEMARILFGLDPIAAGTIAIDGAAARASRRPQAAMDRGIAFLTEDRRAEGLMMAAPIADNIGLPSLPRFAAGCGRLLERTRLGDAVERDRPRRPGQRRATSSRRWSRTSRAATSRRS